jgi:small subunit ribosomal protein S16
MRKRLAQMVVIRLSRVGSVNSPKYRVTVADSRRPTCGKFIEVVGTYNPNPRGKEKEVVINLEKINHWISKGAQPTDRVKKIMKLAASAQ